MATLNKVKKEHIHQNIINQIKAMIENGDLNAGDRLPPERELSEILGVSRVPVREALKILQFIKVIEVKQGSYYSVKGIGRANLLDLLDGVSNKKYENILEDLKEIRVCIETCAVKFACERRTEKDLNKMLSCIKEMEEAVDEKESEPKVIRSSMKFHDYIMLATHNELFSVIFSYINDLMMEGRIKTLTVPNRYKKAISEHIELYEAIKERSPEKAISIIENHIRTSY